MSSLPKKNQKKVIFQICRNIIETSTFLINTEIVQKVLIFISPLFSDTSMNDQDLQEISVILHYVQSCKA